nr:hypothetical protein [Micromonospora sp. DSM 115978]
MDQLPPIQAGPDPLTGAGGPPSRAETAETVTFTPAQDLMLRRAASRTTMTSAETLVAAVALLDLATGLRPGRSLAVEIPFRAAVVRQEGLAGDVVVVRTRLVDRIRAATLAGCGVLAGGAIVAALVWWLP